MTESHETLTAITAKVVAAFLGNNHVAAATFRRHHHGVSWLPHHRQAGRTAGGTTEAGRFSPEVGDAGLHHLPVEDGKKLKMLKRHLRTTYGMTPEDYRAKWGLPADYPMVAPDYAAERSAMAVKIGLGRQTGCGAGGGACSGTQGAEETRSGQKGGLNAHPIRWTARLRRPAAEAPLPWGFFPRRPFLLGRLGRKSGPENDIRGRPRGQARAPNSREPSPLRRLGPPGVDFWRIRRVGDFNPGADGECPSKRFSRLDDAAPPRGCPPPSRCRCGRPPPRRPAGGCRERSRATIPCRVRSGAPPTPTRPPFRRGLPVTIRDGSG